MRLPSFAIGLAAALGGALLVAPREARACSCIQPAPPLEAAARSAAVFEGRSFATTREGNLVRYEFEVLRVWKGEVGSRVTVTSAVSSATCGRSFETGVPYVVYAGSGVAGDLSDTSCSRSRPSSHASEDLELLGAGRPPVRPAAPPPAEPAMLEPPRIEPTAVPIPSTRRRGCAVDGPRSSLSLLVALALLRRRRPVKGTTP